VFAYIRGKLAEKKPMMVVLDTQGVGYEIRIPLSTFEKLPALGAEAKLLIHYAHSEDDIRLYGFCTEEEREFFRLLIGVSRIGPKLALSVLSGLSVKNLIDAIQTGEIDILASIPGLGKKTAQRLVVELKDKVDGIALPLSDSMPVSVPRSILQEAEVALLTLGYKTPDIKRAWKAVLNPETSLSTESIIKVTIRYLYQQVPQ
jgi:Holliday junction DNA helicase RuvA